MTSMSDIPTNDTTVTMQEIKASVLHGPKDVRIETRSLDPPQPNELQIAVKATGLCGSDLHYFHHHRNGDIIVREPLSLGHESAGIVEAIGSQVPSGLFRVGDKIALEVGKPCKQCKRCQEGRYNICKDMKFRSSAKSVPHYQGTLQTKINQPFEWCHKLPEDITLEQGALLEPLSVGIHAVRRSQLQANSTILVFGAGAVGLLTAAVAKSMNTAKVVIADINQKRVEFAVEHGFADASVVIPLKRGKDTAECLAIAQDVASACQQKLEADQEFDVTFECTGVESCVQAAIYATRPGGKVMAVGMGTPILTLPGSTAFLREVDLLGVFRYCNTYQWGIEALADRPALKGLLDCVTHRFYGLENVAKAFERAGSMEDEEGNLVIKVLILL